jgi:hypothetical protein
MSLDNNYPSSNLSPGPDRASSSVRDTSRMRETWSLDRYSNETYGWPALGPGVKLQAPSSKQQALDKITIL